ncbi:hypothetical protein C0992_010215, partial [Termitomyces sp. T32_za158]
MKTQRMNAELPSGVAKKKVHHFIGDIAAQWKLLLDEDKKQLTEEKVIALHKTCEMHDLAAYNVPISVFHNMHTILNNLDEE